jgi:hypothetical protein
MQLYGAEEREDRERKTVMLRALTNQFADVSILLD